MLSATLAAIFLLSAGCSARDESPVLPLPEGSTLLTDARAEGAQIRLVQTREGRIVALVRTKSGEMGTLQQEESGLHPVRGWIGGLQVVAGRTPEVPGPRYEVMTAEGKVLKGRLGAKWFIVAWSAPQPTPRYLFRILDEKGIERYRWPPPGRSPIARMFPQKENVT